MTVAKILDIYGKELWSDDKPTVRESVVAAVASRANLSGAYLSRANLRDALKRASEVGLSVRRKTSGEYHVSAPWEPARRVCVDSHRKDTSRCLVRLIRWAERQRVPA